MTKLKISKHALVQAVLLAGGTVLSGLSLAATLNLTTGTDSIDAASTFNTSATDSAVSVDGSGTVLTVNAPATAVGAVGDTLSPMVLSNGGVINSVSTGTIVVTSVKANLSALVIKGAGSALNADDKITVSSAGTGIEILDGAKLAATLPAATIKVSTAVNGVSVSGAGSTLTIPSLDIAASAIGLVVDRAKVTLLKTGTKFDIQAPLAIQASNKAVLKLDSAALRSLTPTSQGIAITGGASVTLENIAVNPSGGETNDFIFSCFGSNSSLAITGSSSNLALGSIGGNGNGLMIGSGCKATFAEGNYVADGGYLVYATNKETTPVVANSYLDLTNSTVPGAAEKETIPPVAKYKDEQIFSSEGTTIYADKKSILNVVAKNVSIRNESDVIKTDTDGVVNLNLLETSHLKGAVANPKGNISLSAKSLWELTDSSSLFDLNLAGAAYFPSYNLSSTLTVNGNLTSEWNSKIAVNINFTTQKANQIIVEGDLISNATLLINPMQAAALNLSTPPVKVATVKGKNSKGTKFVATASQRPNNDDLSLGYNMIQLGSDWYITVTDRISCGFTNSAGVAVNKAFPKEKLTLTCNNIARYSHIVLEHGGLCDKPRAEVNDDIISCVVEAGTLGEHPLIITKSSLGMRTGRAQLQLTLSEQNVPASTPVTLGLLGAALVAIGSVRRKLKKAA